MSRYTVWFSLLLASACGGTTHTHEEGGDGGSTSADGSTSTGGKGDAGGMSSRTREPKTHRAAEVTCGTPPPAPSGASGPSPDPMMCTTSADCTAGPNGRCLQGRFAGKFCVYDACFQDEDCASGGVCQCGSPTGYGNACVQSGCRIDADCPGSYCSPTFGTCGTYSGVIGYQCHTSGDACVDDADCGGTGAYCMYDPDVAHWVCSSSLCAG